MYNYKTEKRRIIERLAREMAAFYFEWHDEMTETEVSQFIDSVIPLLKRDTQNALYDMDDIDDNYD